MTTTFFATQAEFRKWLKKHHKKETELLVRFYKVSSDNPSMTWSESVDQALCFGWIDGTRKSIDKESYCIRFTPRKSNSVWSPVNIKKVEAINKSGLMTPEGQKAFDLRTENRSGIYSHENEIVNLDATYEKKIKQNKIAWIFLLNKHLPIKK